jgi:tetratricopeptide (TPR) repeat protein
MAQAIETLQKAFQASAGRPERPQVTAALLSAYEIVLQSTADPRAQAQVKFNLAEVHLASGESGAAIRRYREVVALEPQLQAAEKALVQRAALAALGARYEELQSAQGFPREVRAQAPSGSPPRALPAAMVEWLSWVDEAPRLGLAGEPQYAQYRFESYRVRYASGRMEEALERMEPEIRSAPHAKNALPMAALVLDTTLAAKDWKLALEQVEAFSQLFAAVPAAREKGFLTQLRDVGADALLKLAEESFARKEYPETFEQIERLASRFQGAPRVLDAWVLGAHAALAAGDRPRALSYFARRMKERPEPQVELQAALTAASLAEEEYRFGAAARELRKALGVPKEVLRAAGVVPGPLQRKVLTYLWLEGEGDVLWKAAQDPLVCAGPMVFECEQFALFETARRRLPWRGRASSFAAWYAALSALEGNSLTESAALGQELVRASELWPKVDARFRALFYSRMAEALPRQLIRFVESVERSAPVSLDPKTIARRTQRIELAARTLERLVQGGVLEVQGAALFAWAELYASLTRKTPATEGACWPGAARIPSDARGVDGAVPHTRE